MLVNQIHGAVCEQSLDLGFGVSARSAHVEEAVFFEVDLEKLDNRAVFLPAATWNKLLDVNATALLEGGKLDGIDAVAGTSAATLGHVDCLQLARMDPAQDFRGINLKSLTDLPCGLPHRVFRHDAPSQIRQRRKTKAPVSRPGEALTGAETRRCATQVFFAQFAGSSFDRSPTLRGDESIRTAKRRFAARAAIGSS